MVFNETTNIADKILDTLNSAILCVDEHHVVNYVSAAAEELFSMSASSLYGKPFEQLFSPAEDNAITRKINCIGDDSPAITQHDAEITLATGKTFSADYSFYQMEGEDVVRNILVEIKPLDWQSQVAREKLANLRKQASLQFSQGMAHEIKNPLGGIRGAAQLLERELDDPKMKQYTEVITNEVDRLTALINSMLGPNKELIKSSLNIHEVLEHIRRLVLVAELGRVNIKIDYDPSIPELQGDQRQLIQAILNLAQNAAQSIDTEGEIVFKTRIGRQFTVGEVIHPLVVQVDISDTGSGIASDIQDTIFLPMVTNKAEGSGLGLPIAQEIISRHGGIIFFHSSPQGTTFSTILPLTMAQTDTSL